MDSDPAVSRRPAELLLRAHLAHADHHELLAHDQKVRLHEAVASVSGAPAESTAPARKPRGRRKK